MTALREPSGDYRKSGRARCCVQLLLVMALFVSPHVIADSPAVVVPLRSVIDASLTVLTEPRAPETASLVLVEQKVENRSGVAWSGMRVRLLRFDFAGRRFGESVTGAGVGRSVPEPVWRAELLLRRNGEYLGGEGGEWRAQRSANPDQVTYRFDHVQVRHGDEITLRFLMDGGGPETWRLKIDAEPDASVPARRPQPWGSLGLMAVGVLGLIWSSRRK